MDVEYSAIHEEKTASLRHCKKLVIATSLLAFAQAAIVGVQEQTSPQAEPAGEEDSSRCASTPNRIVSIASRTAVGAATMPTPAAAVTQQMLKNDFNPAAFTFHNTQWFGADQSVLEQELNGPIVTVHSKLLLREIWTLNTVKVTPCHGSTIFYACPLHIYFCHLFTS